jgi:RNA polymerase sigma-70 factor, ECF subfamily
MSSESEGEVMAIRRARAIARGAKTENAEAEEVFRRCEARLGGFLAQFVRDRQLAEDLLQDTFHDALRSWASVTAAANEEAWLFGIARNRALQALRRRRRFDRALARLSARRAAESEPAETVALRDLMERTLSAEDRALILLRYLHEFDASELAAMTGLSSQAIRQRLARARKRLLTAAAEPQDTK